MPNQSARQWAPWPIISMKTVTTGKLSAISMTWIMKNTRRNTAVHVREFLAPEGVDEEDIRTIISHGWGVCTDEFEPATPLEKSLFTVDELTGIIMAYALMRPEGIDGMELKGFKKKFKAKSLPRDAAVMSSNKVSTCSVLIRTS